MVQRVIAHPELIYSDIIAPAVASNTITIQSSGRLTSADLEAVKKALSEYFFERVNGTTGLALADSNASPQTEIRSQRWYGNIYQFLVQEGQNLIENTQTDYEKMKNLVEVFSEELAAEGYREITAQDIKIIVEIFNAQKGALYANESMDTDLAKTMRTLAGQKKIPGYLATPQSNIEAARAAVASVLAGPLAKTYQGVLHEAAFLPRHEISLLASVGTRFAAAIDGFAPLVLSPKVVTSQLANGTQAVEAMINVSEFASAVPVTDTLERLRGKITGPVNLDAYIAAAQAHGDIHTATHLIALREASKSSGARPLNDAFIRNYLEVAASAGKPEQLAKTLLLQAKARAEGQSTLRAASVRALPEHREGAKVVELGPESAKEIVHPTKPKAALPPLPITGKK